MTDREREIYELIQANPLISQSEIAEHLSIARASVAVHISNLVKKGYLLGKGYIMAYSQPVTVIGGANVDIQGRPEGKLLMEDSNPGFIESSLGGVGRNIADNLKMLDVDTRMMTAVGDDKEGMLIRDNARTLGIDMEDTIVSREHRTSTYMYVLDEMGEMVVAVSDMGIVETLTPTHFKKLLPKIDHSPYTVIDANLPERTINYLAANLEKTKLVLDPVSITKAHRVNGVLDRFYAAKLNRLEAEAITGITLDSQEVITRVGEAIVKKGVKRVFITLGGEGVYYHDLEGGFFREAIKTDVINATGAGDAFTAAMVYGFVNELEREALVDFCIGASTVAMLNKNTIADNMSVETVKNQISNQEKNL